ncbi:MAG: Gfo/Idh/MocA family oxidoreductase [Bacteroidota bacterium]
MNRRTFIKHSTTGVAASTAYSALPLLPSLRPSPMKRYRIALIGCGWWGTNILREAIYAKTGQVVGLCDVDDRQTDHTFWEVRELTGGAPKTFRDYRECITQTKPEIVIVGTPDHWHALPTIFALENGAHVYVEKPIGHTINEGKAMVAAARKYGKQVQVGTHRRVSAHNISAMEFLRSGKLGQIGKVKCFVNYSGGPGMPTPDSEAPKELDWDMWCGPAPLTPYNTRIHPKGFRNFLDYANGTIADWGIHWFDQVLWWTEEKYPKTIYSTGNRYIKQDNSDAPDSQFATFEFESFTCTWENKQNIKNYNEDHNIGCYFYGTEGTLHLGWRDGWTFYPRNTKDSTIHVDPQLNTPDFQNIKELWADFIDSIENSRLPACDIEIGHRSTNMSLLAMLSYKAGRSIQWDGEKEMIIGDPEANKLLSRAYRGDWEYPRV